MPIWKTRSLDYQTALRDIAKSLVRLKRPERLLKMITRFLVRELQVSNAAILILDPEKSRYTIFDSRGPHKLPKGLFRLDASHPLIRWLQTKDKAMGNLRNYIDRLQIQDLLRGSSTLLRDRPELQKDLMEVGRVLDDLRAEIAIPGHFKGDLVGILLLGRRVNNRRRFNQTEIHFFQILVHDAAIAVKTSEYHQNLIERNIELEAKKKELEEKLREIERLRTKEQTTYYEIVKSLAEEVRAKDSYTYGHIHEVEKLGIMTAEELGMDISGRRRDILSAALLLHDVGKIGIPDNILKKPAALTPEEWEVMRSHVDRGVKILAPLSDFKEVAEIVRCHHENFDGTGYPRGLKGEQIPLEARIVSVVDAFHAIVSHRCYRRGRTVQLAFEELRRFAGTQFDPDVVKAFIQALQKQLTQADSRR